MVVTQGDIFFVDFNPSIGHEQRNKKPAIALSHDLVARFGGLTIVHQYLQQKESIRHIIL